MVVAVFLVGAVVLVLDGSPLHPNPAEEMVPAWFPDGHYEGTYGLAVWADDDLLEVRWITEDSLPGFFQVTDRDGAVLFEQVTERSRAHGVLLPRPQASGIVLRYGARVPAAPRMHQTALRLSEVSDRSRRPPASFSAADSLFVVGDVHGEMDRLVRLLRTGGLVDEALRWTGGRSHLVFTGDLFGRGPDVTRLLWFVYELEAQAEEAGGRVHTLLGNHEIDALTGEPRHISPKEEAIATFHNAEYAALYHPRKSFLGQWLASRPAVLRVGPVLLAHGGVSSAMGVHTIEAIHDSVGAYVAEDIFPRLSGHAWELNPDPDVLRARLDFFFGEASLFHYRGYLRSDTLDTALERVLDRFGARVHVVGHTGAATIESHYGGRLIAVNMEEPATEMLLLLRSGGEYHPFRYRLEGPPQPL